MKTIMIPAQSTDIQSLLDQAREDDLILCAADGTQFLLSAVDDFDHEIARTRQNQELMALLDERAKRSEIVTLDAVKQQLGTNK